MTEWSQEGKRIPLSETNFQKIVDFYLFNCPCEIEKGTKKKGTKTYTKVSKRASTLRKQGWTGGHLNTLLAAMKRTSSNHLEYHPVESGKDIIKETANIEKNASMSDKNFEMIIFAKRTDMNLTSSIFYYIRNAFAHGSFSVISDNARKIYYLESEKEGVVKARIRLNEETLLKWIKDFALSPSVLRSELEKNRQSKRKTAKKVAA